MEPEHANPYLPPESPLAPAEGFEMPVEDLPPIPFEDEVRYPTFWDRVRSTLMLGYTAPFELADRVPVTDRLFPAWLFYLLVQLPFSIIGAAMGFAFRGVMQRFLNAPVQDGQAMQMALQIGGQLGALLLGIFVYGAIVHACLWILGGTRQKRGVAQTIRAMGYGGALLAPLSWIPLLGGLLALAWMALFGVGLARVHRTDTWRGVCAMFLPMVLICVLGVITVAVVAGIGLSRMGH